MASYVVSERYAEGLFDLAKEKDLVQNIQEDLNSFTKLLEDYGDLKNLLFHPVISKEDKKDIINKIVKKDDVSEYSLNFILFLIDKGRETLIEEMVAIYNTLVNKLQSKVVAQIYTAIEIKGEMVDFLKKELETYLDKKVEVESHIDTSILGGVLVKIDDRVIDGTLSSRFKNISKELV